MTNPQAPQVSEDLANILKALVYTEDVFDKVRLVGIAKTFLARHERELGCEEWVIHAKARAFKIEQDLTDELWGKKE